MGFFSDALNRPAPAVKAAIAQAVEMEAAIIEDLADLDLLDDTVRHAACDICCPPGGQLYGRPFTAWCGKRALWLSGAGYAARKTPADACPDCAASKQCAVCGIRSR